MVDGIENQTCCTYRESLDNFGDYPNNLVIPDTYDYVRKHYKEQLSQAEADFLFCEDAEDAEVVLRTLREDEADFGETCLGNLAQTRSTLVESGPNETKVPVCRFYFLEAPSGRDPLNITRDMFNYLFTYEQVMSQFLDFVFTFGGQDFAKEPLFGGLRSRLSLGERPRSLNDTNDTGICQKIQICYNLQNPEIFRSEWSIRQTAAYHSFDIDTGYTSWIIIKGNSLIRKRIISETCQNKPFGPTAYNSPKERFRASFAPQLILSEWAGENWRWYIKFLEDEIQAISRRILWTGVSQRVPTGSRSGDTTKNASAIQKTSPIRWWTARLKNNLPLHWTKPNTSSSQDTGEIELRATVQEFTTEQVMNVLGYSFKDLQTLYYYDEKAKEASMILKNNINTLRALVKSYQTVLNSESFPIEIKTHCKMSITRFLMQVDEIIQHLEFQDSRLGSLLQLITDRKTLLLQMLEYVKTNTSLYLSYQAQTTADRTQDLTEDMAYIAERTAKSTTSMKAITIITLLFLPGTFISTIMSTDIVRFHREEKTYSSGALKLYLQASLPLMFFSIVFWCIMYQLSSRREAEGKHRAKLKAKLGMGSEDHV